MLGTVRLLLVAGIDTTWSAIGAFIWHLAKTPEHRRRLATEPELMPTAIEELFDRRTVFYGGYYRTIKHFARSLPKHVGVSWADFSTYITAFIKELDEQKSGATFTRTQVTAPDGIPRFVPPGWVDPERKPLRNRYWQAGAAPPADP